MREIEDDEVATKRICHDCVGETYLASTIRSMREEVSCDYCGESGPSVHIGVLAEMIETAFSIHYVRTANQPDSWQERLIADHESDYEWYREGLPISDAIQDAACIDEKPANDVLEILQGKHAIYPGNDYCGEESEFSFDSYYSRRRPNFIGLHMGWYDFERSLKTKARFFSRTAEELLSRIFGGVDTLKTRDGRLLVIDAGPNTSLDHLYRARVFQGEERLKVALCQPDSHLGSPPPKMARAGRMNAQGISVFYGATEAAVAIVEVRPPVGSRAIVARFDITRRLRLLDLTAVNDVHQEGSIFDPLFRERSHRAEFLRSLRWRMARPVMPDDEGIDYLPTQAVADFLATTNEPRLDGIIFPSVQVEDGYNVVLFHESARVTRETVPPGTDIRATTGHNTEDGWEVEYSVTEIVPASEASKSNGDVYGHLDAFLYSDQLAESDDERTDTLRLTPASVEVHDVTWVTVKTQPHTVTRYRVEKRPSDF